MNIKYIDTGTLYEGLKGAVVNNSTRISQKNGIPYIEFTPFDEFDWVTLHFSTRDGGVSKGIYSSMNFSLTGAMIMKMYIRIMSYFLIQ